MFPNLLRKLIVRVTASFSTKVSAVNRCYQNNRIYLVQMQRSNIFKCHLGEGFLNKQPFQVVIACQNQRSLQLPLKCVRESLFVFMTYVTRPWKLFASYNLSHLKNLFIKISSLTLRRNDATYYKIRTISTAVYTGRYTLLTGRKENRKNSENKMLKNQL